MGRLGEMVSIARAVGIDNLRRRVSHEAERRLGLLERKLPGGEPDAAAYAAAFNYGLDPEDAPRLWRERAFKLLPLSSDSMRGELEALDEWQTRQARILEPARAVRRGRFQMFGHGQFEAGFPPIFARDPIHGVDWPMGPYFTEYRQFDPDRADLKCVWELSRFSWAYLLARAHARGADRAAETYWTLFDAWDRQSPFCQSVPWACAQESTFRMMAMVFAACVMREDPSSTPARLRRTAQLAWMTGRRIEATLTYARGQKNNHALSEAAGLMTLGALFPELEAARAWFARGRTVLIEELTRQIYDDGSYVQHSTNYHRVMLDDVCWAIRMAEIGGDPLPEPTLRRVSRAVCWLEELVDPETGRAPNYGLNDGAQVLPLASTDYPDHRPTIQAARALLDQGRAYGPGAWDEMTLWLRGSEALGAAVTPRVKEPEYRADDGGYYVMRGPTSEAFTRCHTYRDRPGQADMLHLSLRVGSRWIVRDGGSYHYYAPEPWQGWFGSTAAHNTVEVDALDQMEKGPSFLWFGWTGSTLLRFDRSEDGRVTFWSGEHLGYRRLRDPVTHRRSILRIDDHWVVIDDLFGQTEHDLVVRWRLEPGDWRLDGNRVLGRAEDAAIGLSTSAPPGFVRELVEARESPTPMGWESLHYAQRTAAPTLVVRGASPLPARIVTVIGVGEGAPQVVDEVDPGGALHLAMVGGTGLAAAVAQVSARRVRVVAGSGPGSQETD